MVEEPFLSEEEKAYLERYQEKSVHRFREILAYCAILEKLTKE